MEDLISSYSRHSSYPKNLISPNTYEHALQDYSKRLSEHKERLFGRSTTSDVDFLNWDASSLSHFTPKHIQTLQDITDLIDQRRSQNQADPLWSFLFFKSPNSRRPLKVSSSAFTMLLSYEQVMPEFLDFVFPFGDQTDPLDTHFAAFRYESRLSDLQPAHAVTGLGRSCFTFQQCYNLRGIERIEYTGNLAPEWPWSMRQTALYHSFDVETGRAFWIVLKSNKKIKSRIEKLIGTTDFTALEQPQPAVESFQTAFKVHAILCDWVRENWRWYINDLERKVNTKSQRALIVDQVHSDLDPQLNRASTMPGLSRPPTLFERGTNQLRRMRRTFSHNTTQSVNLQPISVDRPPASNLLNHSEDPSKFSLRDLQDLQHWEEQITETSLALNMNIGVLREMKEFYSNLLKDQKPSLKDIQRDAAHSVTEFTQVVMITIKELEMFSPWVESLLKLVSKRKELLLNIIDHTNMQLNEKISLRTLSSQDKMERMTEYMHDMTAKTEKETVSMRIVTYVTLFFLPGTFVSTLMSTDIFQFPTNTLQFQSRALWFFFYLTVPIMVTTFIASGFVQLWEDQKTKSRRYQLEMARQP